MSKVSEFEQHLGEGLRRKVARKRKIVRNPKPIPLLPGQRRLAPVRDSLKELQRNELYERNKRLADEAARHDMLAHERRMKR